MMRARLVLGSIAGAMAIHVAFVACGTMMSPGNDAGGSDSGTMDAMIDATVDVINDVIGLEVRDAQAQDAGDGATGACTCSSPPVPDYSFALAIDRGMGPETPSADYSTAGVIWRASMNDGLPGYDVTGDATFYLPDGSTVSLSCEVKLDSSRNVVQTAQGPSALCNVVMSPLSICASGQDAGALPCWRTIDPAVARNIPGATVPTFTDNQVEMRIPSFSVPAASSSTGRTMITISNVIFRGTDPTGTHATPSRAFRP